MKLLFLLLSFNLQKETVMTAWKPIDLCQSSRSVQEWTHLMRSQWVAKLWPGPPTFSRCPSPFPSALPSLDEIQWPLEVVITWVRNNFRVINCVHVDHPVLRINNFICSQTEHYVPKTGFHHGKPITTIFFPQVRRGTWKSQVVEVRFYIRTVKIFLQVIWTFKILDSVLIF